MKTKPAIYGAVATLVAGSLIFGLGAAEAAVPASPKASNSEVRQDAWVNFSDGVQNKEEARIGFDATYVGSYTFEPHMSPDYVVEESAAHPGLWHLFTVSKGN